MPMTVEGVGQQGIHCLPAVRGHFTAQPGVQPQPGVTDATPLAADFLAFVGAEHREMIIEVGKALIVPAKLTGLA